MSQSAAATGSGSGATVVDMRTGRVGLVVVLAVLTMAGCADGGEGAPGTPDPGETPTATPTDPADADGQLPGEPFDAGPEADARLAVVGVAADDVLNLRAGPGVEFEVAAELEPLETDVLATGRNRQLEGSAIWVEATVDGVTGWANLAYLAYLGEVNDITSLLEDAGGSELVDVADRVVAQVWGESADEVDVTVVDGPHYGDLGEITVDGLGLADDSVAGLRLHIFASPDGGRFTMRTVEATTLCSRGVAAGLCI